MPSGATGVLVDVGAFADAPVRLIEQAVERALAAGRAAPTEISVALLDDAAISELNRRYLREDGPTDVIAFTLGEGDEVVGDVYVGVEQARRQAQELSVPLTEELARLTIHGVLHVMGHDHPAGHEREASPMFALQERILRDVLGSGPTV